MRGGGGGRAESLELTGDRFRDGPIDHGWTNDMTGVTVPTSDDPLDRSSSAPFSSASGNHNCWPTKWVSSRYGPSSYFVCWLLLFFLSASFSRLALRLKLAHLRKRGLVLALAFRKRLPKRCSVYRRVYCPAVVLGAGSFREVDLCLRARRFFRPIEKQHVVAVVQSGWL